MDIRILSYEGKTTYTEVIYLENILIVYDSRFGNTEKMAKAIAEGAEDAGSKVSLTKVDQTTKTDLAKYNIILFGSPTNYGTLSTKMRNFLDTLEKGDLKGKVGSTFGSYGWGGGAVEVMTIALRAFEMDVIEPGLARVPVDSFLLIDDCRSFGKRVVKEAMTRLQNKKR